jgi:hypothetical protein
MQSGKHSQQFEMQIRSALKFLFERHDFARELRLALEEVGNDG